MEEKETYTPREIEEILQRYEAVLGAYHGILVMSDKDARYDHLTPRNNFHNALEDFRKVVPKNIQRLLEGRLNNLSEQSRHCS